MTRGLSPFLLLAAALPRPAPARAPAAAPDAPAEAACPARPGWSQMPADAAAARSGGWRPVNWLGVRRGGGFSWNARPLARPALARALAAAAAPRPQPAVVLLRAPGAPCAALAEAAALVETSRLCWPAICILSAGADDRRALAAVRPPPLPPAPAAGPARRARADLSLYVSDDDYPAAAIRAEAQGVTAYALDIDPDGRVARCTIIGSSGSAALDAAACRIMRARARFQPARNAAGEAVPDRITARMTWTMREEPDSAPLPAIGTEPLPDPPPPPPPPQ